MSNRFAKFVNPANRGPNFTWAKFPKMAQDYVETNMWIATGLDETSKNKDKELEFIRTIAKGIAENLIELAGLVDAKTPTES